MDYTNSGILGGVEARAPDGTGNNLTDTLWGSAETPNVRITENSYLDGQGAMNPADNQPTPREITDAVMAQPQENGQDIDIPNSFGVNEFLQFFGQFVAHDINQTRAGTTETILLDGGIFGTFTRNDFVLENGVRQQIDLETSFLDLGTVYGRSQATLDLLRADLIGPDGQKVLDANGNPVQSARLVAGNGTPLPTVLDIATDAGVTTGDVLAATGLLAFGPPDNLYVAGDDRANQTPGLLAPQMVFMQNHNWHVDQLAAKHPDWSQEQLFQAARALNEAEFQHIVYDEYLAKLVGKDALDAYEGYKSGVDPSIINEFASVAFRFGHDQSSNTLTSLAEDGTTQQSITLSQAFALGTAAQAIRTSESLDDWIRGLTAQHTQELDGKVVDGNRNALFGLGVTIDLMAIDIMRGRDQGTGSYNTLREGLGLSTYDSFEAFGAANDLDDATVAALKDLYGADNIDLLDSLVAGLLEKKAAGSMLGETFTKIIVIQFGNIRDGDRLYYENRFKDDPELIAKVQATSLADILARTTGVEHLYRDGFAAHERIGGTEGSETLNGTVGKDLLIGFGGDDEFNAGEGEDDVYGGAGRDVLRGGAGKDHLYGEDGNDRIDGGHGADLMSGGAGNDQFFVALGNDLGAGEKDTVSGGSGTDELIITMNASQAEGVHYDLVRLSYFMQQDAAHPGAHFVSDALHLDIQGIETVRLRVDGVLKTIAEVTGSYTFVHGTNGSETLGGTPGHDVIFGYDGDDVLDAGGGNDYAFGGAGRDVLRGGAGKDHLYGEDGNDRIDGGHGADLMSGGAGNDQFFVALGNDLGAGEKDTVSGGNGTDELIITMTAGQVVSHAHDIVQMTSFMATGAADPDAHFVSDGLHLDFYGIETVRLRVDGVLKTLDQVVSEYALV